MQRSAQMGFVKRLSQAVLGVSVLCTVLLSGATAAHAGVAFSVGPSIPQNIVVGETVPFAISIINNSDNTVAGEVGYDTDSFELTDVTFVPSCGSDINSADCPVGSWDPGVLVPNAVFVPVGRQGSVCANRTFSLSLIDANQGKYRLTANPGPNIVIGPSSGPLTVRRCIIDLRLDVIRTPTIDSDTRAGLQTDQKAAISAIDVGPTNTGQPGGGSGTSDTTIRAAPALTTQASPTIELGGQLTDTATVTGLVSPVTGVGAGTVTFVLYGPGDTTCATPIFTSANRPLTLNAAADPGDGDLGSLHADGPRYVPLDRFLQRRSQQLPGGRDVCVRQRADGRNPGDAGDRDAGFADDRARSGLPDGHRDGDRSGQPDHRRRRRHGDLHGCTAPTTTIARRRSSRARNRPLTLNAAQTTGTATSAPFVPSAAGEYRWIASYSGDSNNAAIAGTCISANEQVVVTQATPDIVTQASPTIELGQGSLTDTATVTGLVNPITGAGAGTISFTLYGPDDDDCSTPIFTSANRPMTLNGSQTTGTATSAAFTPSQARRVSLDRLLQRRRQQRRGLAGTPATANEQVVVAQATPTSRPRLRRRPSRRTVTDTATLAGVCQPAPALEQAR